MKLDVFIAGELIDLCIPTKEYALESDWYSWFNNPKTNRYLEQGIFPNTREDELAFFESERNKRLILAVLDKQGNNLGVISLSFINFAKRKADVAIVMSEKERDRLAALEALARITEHGLTKMGLLRIESGGHQNLTRWLNLTELIGYRLEGIFVKGFVKGNERVNANRKAITIEDYNNIIARRGQLWDSKSKMMERLNKLPKEQFVQKMNRFFETERESYYQLVQSL